MHNLAEAKHSSPNVMSNLNRYLLALKVVLEGHGCTYVDPLSESIMEFAAASSQRQREILTMIGKYVHILQLSMGNPPTNQTSYEQLEGRRIEVAAQEFGMTLADPKVLSLIKEGDVVEIYNTNNRQIYRNLMFCKLSSYSLLDVAVHSWQELYERPVTSLEGIQKRVTEQLTTPVLTQHYDIADHVLKEKLIFAKVRRTFLIQMKYISPLTDLLSGERVGVISIARLETIAAVGQGGSIQTI